MSRQRRIVAGFATALLSAVALVGVPLAPAQAATTRCTNADLHATFHHTDSGAGHRFGRLLLTNASPRPPRAGGSGGRPYVGHGDGPRAGAAATRDRGPVRTIALPPGQRVWSARCRRP